MEKKFKLETILTILTGINLTNNFNEVYELAYFIFDDPYINTSGIILLKNEIINHILTIHIELQNISCVPTSPFKKESWLIPLKKKYGDTLAITKIGKKLKYIKKQDL